MYSEAQQDSTQLSWPLHSENLSSSSDFTHDDKFGFTNTEFLLQITDTCH